ncbi:laminin G domain-containing protein [Streptomyces sp. NBC_01363]|uniref:laminin G domain-containing protein n=1 Tax=Streptomyces sp. NBC_01363 TaxID=2903840 RepID=UPI00224DC33A|nr:laminin G domain-containing protein [Streptomyces sp. NBC_01363]MCX4735610.1 laminin G domain-containing protein [Streptomyces sp. NBC_01363]
MRRRSVLLAVGAAALSSRLGGRAFAAASGGGPLLDHGTPVDLDGSEYVDLSNRVGALAPLTAGTIVVTFRTTSHNEAMTLLSASDPTEPSSDITLNLSGGALQFSVREKGAALINVMTKTRYDDGLRHTVAVTVDSSGTRLHAGGRKVFETARHSFFAAVSGLSALALGRNLDSDHPGGEWFCTGTIERAAVWDRVLDEAELVAQSPRPDLADLGRISTALNSDTPATWVVTGDSITHGALHRYAEERSAEGARLVGLGRRLGRELVENTPDWPTMGPAEVDALSRAALNGADSYLYGSVQRQ